MKKILVIHTKYRITGGEDIAVEKEVAELKKNYTVETLYFSNKSTDNYLLELTRFVTSINLQANKEIETKIKQFQPDIVYIHNTWFKASLGIIKILKKSKSNKASFKGNLILFATANNVDIIGPSTFSVCILIDSPNNLTLKGFSIE